MRQVKKFAIILLANLMFALAVPYFVAPSGMISGGSTGIALSLHHYFSIPLSGALAASNAVFFLLGLLILGWKFAGSTLLSTFAYPAFLTVTEGVAAYTGLPTEDPFLCMMFGGLLFGLGIGLVLRQGGSSGGTDILALILHKKFGLSLSGLLYVLDGVIVLTQCAFSTGEQVLYGLVFILLYSLVVDQILLQGQRRIQLQIISSRWEEINQLLLGRFQRGSTLILIEGGYTREKRYALQTVIAQRELFPLKEQILALDPYAFLVISQVKEVNGRGFTLGKQDG